MQREAETKSTPTYSGLVVLILTFALTALASGSLTESRYQGSDAWGPFPTAQAATTAKLSDYLPTLADTPGDTGVFVLEGGEPGGTALILGGTHGDEVAGVVAATLMLENVQVKQGRVIVIPRANASAATHTLPQEGYPAFFSLQTGEGERRFRFGSRFTNPVDQWPDPEVFIQPASGQELAGAESRNLNRAYPGNPKGSLTQRIAYGIMEVIRQENVTIAFDLHEASPEYPVVNAIVAHPRSMDLAAMVAIELEMQGVSISLEPSPPNLRGLSHREWGELTDALPILMETANPAQGRLRGETDAELVVSGQDPLYQAADKAGHLYAAYPEGGYSIDWRVARHVAGVGAFLQYLTDLYPEKAVVVEGLPNYQQIIADGAGSFLAPGGVD